jgi:hypothetical protein
LRLRLHNGIKKIAMTVFILTPIFKEAEKSGKSGFQDALLNGDKW